jgi:hypothetical protein
LAFWGGSGVGVGAGVGEGVGRCGGWVGGVGVGGVLAGRGAWGFWFCWPEEDAALPLDRPDCPSRLAVAPPPPLLPPDRFCADPPERAGVSAESPSAPRAGGCLSWAVEWLGVPTNRPNAAAREMSVGFRIFMADLPFGPDSGCKAGASTRREVRLRLLARCPGGVVFPVGVDVR